jgi:HK97 family phage major capsid protein
MRLSDKLRARRADVLERAETLSVKAANENRPFDETEQAAFDAAIAEAGSLGKQLDAAVGNEERLRASAGSAIRRTHEADAAAGEVRAYQSNEAMFQRGTVDGEALSLGRLVRAMATRDWSRAPAELRALGENPPSTGGVLVPVELFGQVIDLARNRSVMVRAGTLTFPMATQQMTVAKLLTDPVAAWRAENAVINESEPTFGPVNYRARALAALVRCSVELAEDAPNFNTAIEDAISKAVALELDRAGLLGDGNGETPLGVMMTPGIGTIEMAADGGAPVDYTKLVSAMGLVRTANEEPATVIMSARTATDLDNLKNTLNDAMEPPAAYSALTRLVTNSIPNNQAHGASGGVCSSAVVGDFSKGAFGMRTEGMLEVTRVGGDGTFAQLQILIRLYLRADYHALRPGAFCEVVGIKAAP